MTITISQKILNLKDTTDDECKNAGNFESGLAAKDDTDDNRKIADNFEPFQVAKNITAVC